jgi:hypothetical protein
MAAVSTLFGERDGQDVKAVDTFEVPGVGCSDAPSGGDGSSSDDPVVRANILTRGGQLGPDAGVRTSSEQTERQRGKRGQDCFDERFSTGSVLRGRAMHAVQQFRCRDGGYRDIVVRAELLFQPLAYRGHGRGGREALDGPFKVDEDGGV